MYVYEEEPFNPDCYFILETGKMITLPSTDRSATNSDIRPVLPVVTTPNIMHASPPSNCSSSSNDTINLPSRPAIKHPDDSPV